MSHPDKIELTIEEKSYLQALIESKEVARAFLTEQRSCCCVQKECRQAKFAGGYI